MDEDQLGEQRPDDAQVLAGKLSHFLERVKTAKYIVIFSGAGISTAANIPDFRGPQGLNKKGILGLREHELDCTMPTLAHVLISDLVTAGHVKFVVSSNHDNMHERAGLPVDKIAELFGNAYVEKCLACQRKYRRQVVVPNLGRKCENCGGRLVKTGVRFGGAVPEDELALGTAEARKCDLAIVLGSSMTVSPFCNLPKLAKHMVVVSISPTPVDNAKNTTKINAPCDLVVKTLADHFGVRTRAFTYQQTFNLYHQPLSPTQWRIRITGGAPNEPATCVENVLVTLPGQANSPLTLEKGALEFVKEFNLPGAGGEVRVEIQFMEAYGRPALVRPLALHPAQTTELFQVLAFLHKVTYDETGAFHAALE